MRNTVQRRVILDELRRLTTHPTADELYGLVRRRIPAISLATVYRNLELLSEEGVIRRLWRAGTRRRYDGDARDHYHIRCTSCGRVDDIPASTPGTRLFGYLLKPSGYEVAACYVEFTGVCPACRARRSGGAPVAASSSSAP
jgi:Fur family ferric uptake transcriptional regulator